MNSKVVVAGAGIGGLACALALSRAGVAVELLEQAPAFGEVGAGLQLGPNAVRVLDDWGLSEAVAASCAFPEWLRVCDAHSAAKLGELRLGERCKARYGQPYATMHRADLHRVLLDAVRGQPCVNLHLNTRFAGFKASDTGLQVRCEGLQPIEANALIGADGLWSQIREDLLGADRPRLSGHLAYRGMVAASHLPAALCESVVTAWFGPRLHVVHYPVKRGEWFNLVAVVEGALGEGHGVRSGEDLQSWHREAHKDDLLRALGPVCAELKAMLDAVGEWRLWALHDRTPMASASEHARGRVALLGDAAHPMRPYLAQGAAMAIEDAWTLGRLVESTTSTCDWSAVLDRYAQSRWERNARVQKRSQRNGTVFHASGSLRFARNAAMAVMGESLMDNPWLYSGPPDPVR